MGSAGQTSSGAAVTNMLRLLALLVFARFSSGLRCLSCGSETVDCPIRRNTTIADTDCEGGWCETEFRRGSDLPASLRCIKNDPTQEKNTWCQWPAFGLADVRCVCKGEDRCNNLPKPGRSNRQRNSSTANTPHTLSLLVFLLSINIYSFSQ